jgi:hypothetical protein
MSDFVFSLNLEIDRLEKAIEHIPEVRKLQELQRVRALYINEHPEPGRSATSQLARSIAANLTLDPVFSSPGRKMAPERHKAIEFVSSHLMGQVAPIKTADLLVALQNHGINIGGNDPVNSLSALLSTSGRFLAHGRSGWTLRPSTDGNQVSVSATAENGTPGTEGAGED